MYEIALLSMPDLLIDTENPRLPQPNVGQRDALRAFASHEPAKLVALAYAAHCGLVLHWRAYYDGQTLKIYIDDKEDGSIAVQTKSLASQDDLIIGRRFTGKLADIVVSAE
jgi:hypothetical protein